MSTEMQKKLFSPGGVGGSVMSMRVCGRAPGAVYRKEARVALEEELTRRSQDPRGNKDLAEQHVQGPG